MQKIKNHVAAFLLISLAFVAIMGSNSSKKAFMSNSNHWLPDDFNPNKGVLLVEIAGYRKQPEKMEACMSKNYPYKYQLISLDDLKASTYADKNTYRFILKSIVQEHYTDTYNASTGRTDHMHTTGFDFYFYDRLNEKSYSKSGAEFGWPAESLEKIVKKIVEERQ
jgi:hypothetical protein